MSLRRSYCFDPGFLDSGFELLLLWRWWWFGLLFFQRRRISQINILIFCWHTWHSQFLNLGFEFFLLPIWIICAKFLVLQRHLRNLWVYKNEKLSILRQWVLKVSCEFQSEGAPKLRLTGTKLKEELLLWSQIWPKERKKKQNKLFQGWKKREIKNEIDSLKNLILLKELRLSNNQIKDVNSLRNLTSIEWLYLSNNQIKDVNSLENLKLLRSMNSRVMHLPRLTFWSSIRCTGNSVGRSVLMTLRLPWMDRGFEWLTLKLPQK